MDSRATIELTSSIPDSKVKISFLPSAHSLVLSSGEIKLIRTRHGRIGRISLGVHFDNSVMSTFWIALNTLGATTKLKFILASPNSGQRAYICSFTHITVHATQHCCTPQPATDHFRVVVIYNLCQWCINIPTGWSVPTGFRAWITVSESELDDLCLWAA